MDGCRPHKEAMQPFLNEPAKRLLGGGHNRCHDKLPQLETEADTERLDGKDPKQEKRHVHGSHMLIKTDGDRDIEREMKKRKK